MTSTCSTVSGDRLFAFQASLALTRSRVLRVPQRPQERSRHSLAQRWPWLLVLDRSLYGAWPFIHQQGWQPQVQPFVMERQRLGHLP